MRAVQESGKGKRPGQQVDKSRSPPLYSSKRQRVPPRAEGFKIPGQAQKSTNELNTQAKKKAKKKLSVQQAVGDGKVHKGPGATLN